MKMASKIIQKEKERQEDYFEIRKEIKENCRTLARPAWIEGHIKSHKQSLMNLKEYMEEEVEICKVAHYQGHYTGVNHLNQIKEDIKELSKMIERYD